MTIEQILLIGIPNALFFWLLVQVASRISDKEVRALFNAKDRADRIKATNKFYLELFSLLILMTFYTVFALKAISKIVPEQTGAADVFLFSCLFGMVCSITPTFFKLRKLIKNKKKKQTP